MKKYLTIGILPVLLVLISLASAVSPGDVSLTTPVTNTWTGLTNYTTGFVFEWEDSDDSSYTTANCTLHVGDTNILSLLTNGSYIHSSTLATESTATTLYMDSAVANGTYAYYWTVKCFNASSLDATPAGWTPTARRLYVDNSTPQYLVNNYSFTNATWVTNSDIWFAINGTDTSAATGTYTGYIVNNTGSVKATNTGTGISDLINITYTAPEGTNVLGIKLCDPATNCNATAINYTVYVDTVTPVLTIVTPTDGSTSALNYTFVNVTVVETNNDTVTIDFDGTDYRVPAGNCTEYATYMDCVYNFTGVNNAKDKYVMVYANDSAGNLGNSVNTTFSVDTASTTITTAYNWSITDSTVSYNILVTDLTPNTCTLSLWNSTPSIVTTKTGTWSYGTTTSNCTGTFSSSDISDDGAFTVEYNVTDGAGNSATSNKSGVFTTLKTGWNIATWLGTNDTAPDICDTMEYCTMISKFDNSGKSFTTYSIATPSINNGTYLDHGDPFYVYVSADDYLFQNDQTSVFQTGIENASLYTGGWNILGLFSATTLNTTIYADTYNGTYDNHTALRNINTGAWLNVSDDKFYSCIKSSGYCSPFSLDFEAVNVSLVKGYAALTLVDSNITINRTRIS